MTQIVECYRQHRATVAAEDRPCPECNGECDGPGSCRTCNGAGIERRFKTDVLEPEEMKLAVKWLLEQIHETEPEWRPDA